MTKRIKTYDVPEYRCPICQSGQILHRQTPDNHRCRKCGNIFKLNIVKAKKVKQAK